HLQALVKLALVAEVPAPGASRGDLEQRTRHALFFPGAERAATMLADALGNEHVGIAAATGVPSLVIPDNIGRDVHARHVSEVVFESLAQSANRNAVIIRITHEPSIGIGIAGIDRSPREWGIGQAHHRLPPLRAHVPESNWIVPTFNRAGEARKSACQRRDLL